MPQQSLSKAVTRQIFCIRSLWVQSVQLVGILVGDSLVVDCIWIADSCPIQRKVREDKSGSIMPPNRDKFRATSARLKYVSRYLTYSVRVRVQSKVLSTAVNVDIRHLGTAFSRRSGLLLLLFFFFPCRSIV